MEEIEWILKRRKNKNIANIIFILYLLVGFSLFAIKNIGLRYSCLVTWAFIYALLILFSYIKKGK